MSTAVFAGSFDPFTVGHADIVERGLHVFDNIIIGIGYNEHKSGSSSCDNRRQAIERLYAGEPRVKVLVYTGLTVEFVRRCGADVLLRGARGSADFEYERNLADTNRAVAGVETVILVARPEFAFVSSSMVRELMHNGFDVSRFVAVDSY